MASEEVRVSEKFWFLAGQNRKSKRVTRRAVLRAIFALQSPLLMGLYPFLRFDRQTENWVKSLGKSRCY